MAQLHYGDPEARRQAVADFDHNDAIKVQGEGYGALPIDDTEKSYNSPPPPPSSEAPLQVHHQRNDPFTADKHSPAVDVSAGYGDLESKQEDTRGDGNLASPQLENASGYEKPSESKQEDASGYGNFEPKQEDASIYESKQEDTRGYGNFEPKQEDASIYRNLESKQEDAGKVSPASGYTNLEDQQDDSRRFLPVSGYDGGQPKQGYTSLGIEESQDGINSRENSPEGHIEEGNNMKEREAATAPYESMAKEVEDYPAIGGGAIDVQSLKKDFVDLSQGNTDESRDQRGEGAPYGNTEKREEREGTPHEETPLAFSGLNTEEQAVEREADAVPPPKSMADEREGDSSAGGIIDVQSLKNDYVDISDGHSNDLKVDDPIGASHADTSQFTSQIKSPIDDPKQSYSVDDPKQELPSDDSSKQEDFSVYPKQESPSGVDSADTSQFPSQIKSPIDDAKQNHSVDDSKQELPSDNSSKQEDFSDYHKQESPIGVDSADTSQFTSQIKSPIDDPKQSYSVDDLKQEFPSDDSSKQEDFSDHPKQESAIGVDSADTSQFTSQIKSPIDDPKQSYSVDGSNQEPPSDDSSKQEDFSDYPKQESPIGVDSADTSQFTSQIKSPIDDPKQSYSVDDSKQELPSDDSSKQEDFSNYPKQEYPIDVDSTKEEASINHFKQEPPVDDSSKKEDSIDDVKQRSLFGTPFGTPKQKDAINDPVQESPIDDSVQKIEDCTDQKSTINDPEEERSTEASKLESPIDDAELQHQDKVCPNDDDAHGCETFQGDDGKEKIKAEGYNIYSGEPENVVYNAAEVLGDQHEKSTHENEEDAEMEPRENSSTHEGEGDVAMKPREDPSTYEDEGVASMKPREDPSTYEDEGNASMKPCEGLSAQESSSPEVDTKDAFEKVSGFDITKNVQSRDFDSKEHDEHEEPSTQHVSSAVEQDVGLKLDSEDWDARERDSAENVPADEKSPSSKEFKSDSSALEQDAGFKVDSKDREDSSAVEQEDLSAQESSSPEVDTKDALKKVSAFDNTENVQARDFDSKEHDEHEEPFTQHFSSAVEQDVGLKLDSKDWDARERDSAENVPADEKSPYSKESEFKSDSSALEQDAGFKVDPKDREDSSAVEQEAGYKMTSEEKEEDANKRENVENVHGNEEFPYTVLEKEEDANERENVENVHGNEEFPFTNDLKADYGAEGSVPKHNEDADRDLREPSEKVEQEEESRPTDAAMKPCEDMSAQESSAPEVITQDALKKVSGFDFKQGRDFDSKEQHVSSAVEQDAGLKLESEDLDKDAKEIEDAENVPADKKSPFSEVFRIDSSALEQDAGLKVDSKDSEDSSAVEQEAGRRMDKEAYASERENVENVVPGNEESPYTDFDDTNDYVQAGYGGEGFVPKHNEDVDRELREPSEKVEQEEERRRTDEHPLESPGKGDTEAIKQERDREMASSGDVYRTAEGDDTKEGKVEGIAYGQDDADCINIEVPQRAPSSLHPQPDDLNAVAFTNRENISSNEVDGHENPEGPHKDNSSEDDGHQNHEAAPHKRSVFEKIKDKLTPPYSHHH